MKRADLQKWLGYDFETWTEQDAEQGETIAFRQFIEDVKAYCKKEAGREYRVKFSKGFFYFSCFFTNIRTGKVAYIMSSDVRHSPGAWFNNMLFRTAKDENDTTGGPNQWGTLVSLKARLKNMTDWKGDAV
jgi:hypothetical protein